MGEIRRLSFKETQSSMNVDSRQNGHSQGKCLLGCIWLTYSIILSGYEMTIKAINKSNMVEEEADMLFQSSRFVFIT